MTAVAEGKFVFSEEGLDAVNVKLDKTRAKANTLLATLPKELQKQLKEMGKAMGDELKAIVPAAMNSLQGAITAPGKSTFAQVIAEANRARRDASLIAVSTGRDVTDTNARIENTAKLTKEMPSSVVAWSRSVRALTSDWQGAISSMAAMKDVALALDVPIESLVGSSARLRNSFGMKSQEDVNRFFAVMNTQATAAGTTFEKSAKQFLVFQDAFGRMSSRGANSFSGMTAAFAASNADPEQAQRNQGFGMGLLNSGVRQIEQRMRRGGILKRGESITDSETGEVDPKKYLKAMQFLQKDVIKYYGSKKRAIEVQAGDDLEERRNVGGFLNADLSKVSKLSDLPPEQLKAMERYSGLAAGKRDDADIKKHLADRAAGAPLLPGQDEMVELGGGHAGIAMEQAAGLFSTAVDRFGGIVTSAVTALGGAMTTSAGRAALIKAAPKVAGKVLSRVAPVASLATMDGAPEPEAQARAQRYYDQESFEKNDMGGKGVLAPEPTPFDFSKFGAAIRNGAPIQVQIVPSLTGPAPMPGPE